LLWEPDESMAGSGACTSQRSTPGRFQEANCISITHPQVNASENPIHANFVSGFVGTKLGSTPASNRPALRGVKPSQHHLTWNRSSEGLQWSSIVKLSQLLCEISKRHHTSSVCSASQAISQPWSPEPVLSSWMGIPTTEARQPRRCAFKAIRNGCLGMDVQEWLESEHHRL
jgi:hypothetical protein